jgi:hypothetical protein
LFGLDANGLSYRYFHDIFYFVYLLVDAGEFKACPLLHHFCLIIDGCDIERADNLKAAFSQFLVDALGFKECE